MPPKLSPPKVVPDAKDLRGILAFRMRTLRCELGWSQEELSFQSGLNRTFVSAIERRQWNITLGSLDALAQALNVEPWTLLVPLQQKADPVKTKQARKSEPK